MPANIQDFFDILAELLEERKLRCAVTESFKGGLVTGVCAFIGSLLLGPAGLIVGGAVGGGISAVSAHNKFQPVALVLRDMNAIQKQRLFDKIKYAFRNFGPQDVATLSMLVLSQTSLSELAINEVINFLKNDMHLTIQ